MFFRLHLHMPLTPSSTIDHPPPSGSKAGVSNKAFSNIVTRLQTVIRNQTEGADFDGDARARDQASRVMLTIIENELGVTTGDVKSQEEMQKLQEQLQDAWEAVARTERKAENWRKNWEV